MTKAAVSPTSGLPPCWAFTKKKVENKGPSSTPQQAILGDTTPLHTSSQDVQSGFGGRWRLRGMAATKRSSNVATTQQHAWTSHGVSWSALYKSNTSCRRKEYLFLLRL